MFVCFVSLFVITNTLLNPAVGTLSKAVHSFDATSVLCLISTRTEARVTTEPYAYRERQTVTAGQARKLGGRKQLKFENIAFTASATENGVGTLLNNFPNFFSIEWKK